MSIALSLSRTAHAHHERRNRKKEPDQCIAEVSTIKVSSKVCRYRPWQKEMLR